MTVFDLYGVKADNIDEARDKVERALRVHLTAHESSYHGGGYFRLGNDNSNGLVLQTNYDPYEGEWFEAEFSDWPFILYVNNVDEQEQVKDALLNCGIVSLRRDEV